MQHMDEGRLQAWLDLPRSGLAPDEAEAVARHLERCETCRTRVEELERATDRIDALLAPDGHDLDDVPAFDGVVARARELRAGVKGRPRAQRPWLAAGWAASVVLAIGAGWVGNEMIRRGDVPASSASPELQASRASAPEAALPPEIEIPPPPERMARAEQEVTDVPAVSPEQPEPAERVASPAAPATAAPTMADLAADTAALVIRGRITDPAGRPLEAAQISTADGAGTLSRADGTFEFELPTRARPADSAVTVQVQLLGYTSDRRALPVTRGAVTTDFQLSPAAIQLSELVVTGAAPAPEAAERGRSADDARPLLVPLGSSPELWSSDSLEGATDRAGFRPLTIEGLEVVGVASALFQGEPVVRITQVLATGQHIVLLQARRTIAAQPSNTDTTIEGTTVGGLHVVASAPLVPEALRRLLSELR